MHEQQDSRAGMRSADADVEELAAITEGDRPVLTMRSRLTRWWPSTTTGLFLGTAFVRARKASSRVRRVSARFGRTVL